ncbi:hypothetical protein JYT22_00475 [Endomicrobium sp. AH-315-J14]|nr:hypothetical protein [Endomicrobium sp. AH-315-J14]
MTQEMRRLETRVLIMLALLLTMAMPACKSDKHLGPVPPASSDPEGKDLVPGVIVAANEKSGGIRIYKVIEEVYFPKPVGNELVMLAYHEKANTFQHASDLWKQGGMTIAHSKVRVAKHRFITRDHRVIATAAVTPADMTAKAVDAPAR